MFLILHYCIGVLFPVSEWHLNGRTSWPQDGALLEDLTISDVVRRVWKLGGTL